jgi:hypothetical protein
MATDEERLAARVSFDRDWGGRNHLQSLEDEVGPTHSYRPSQGREGDQIGSWVERMQRASTFAP